MSAPFFNNVLAKCKEIFDFHNEEKENSWETLDLDFLRAKLREEIEEWDVELFLDGAGELSELLDIINVALMLSDRLMRGKEIIKHDSEELKSGE